MSTTQDREGRFTKTSPKEQASISAMGLASVLVPFGRILYSLVFLDLGVGYLMPETISAAADRGIPFASTLIPLLGVLAISGALSVLLGYKARIGALLLILFLIPATLLMHNFWVIDDEAARAVQKLHFVKNASLLGATILICFFGPGLVDLGSWLEQRRTEKKRSSADGNLFHPKKI